MLMIHCQFPKFILMAVLISSANCANASIQRQSWQSFFNLASDQRCHLRHSHTKHLWQPASTNPDAPEFNPESPQLIQELMAPFTQDSLAEKALKSEQSHRKPHVLTIGQGQQETLAMYLQNSLDGKTRGNIAHLQKTQRYLHIFQ